MTGPVDLAAAALAIEPGGDARTEWGIRWPSGYIERRKSRREAEWKISDRHEDGFPDGAVVSRTVVAWKPEQYRQPGARYFGPWREA